MGIRDQQIHNQLARETSFVYADSDLTTYRIKIQRPGCPPIVGTLSDYPRVIGRAPESDFVLKEDSVSRKHARIYLLDDTVHIEDLNSSNGVLLNGTRIRHAAVRPTDSVRVGNYTIRVEPITSVGRTVVGNRAELEYQDVAPIHDQWVDQNHTALSFLYRLSQRMSKERDLRTLLQIVLDEIMEVLPAERSFILTRPDPQADPQICVAASRQPRGTAPPISRTVVEHVQNTRSSVLTADAREDERFESSESIVAHDIKAALCVPLTSHDTVFGVIYADADAEPMPFTQTHLHLLSVVGQVAGSAVENIQLIEKQIHQERLAAIGQTVSATSHDMRNILTGISGGAQLLDAAFEQKNWDRTAKATRLIQTSLKRFENLVNSLLTFARKTELCLAQTHVGTLVREVVEAMEPEAAKHGIAIQVDDRLNHKVYLDVQQMHRVLFNLVKNAIDAMEGCGGAITIETESDDGADFVRVRDTGPGIAPEHLPRIGQAFFTTKEGRGTGLGLAVCFRIMEQHQGSIRVDSIPGSGTTFTLVFPDLSRTTARIHRISA